MKIFKNINSGDSSILKIVQPLGIFFIGSIIVNFIVKW